MRWVLTNRTDGTETDRKSVGFHQTEREPIQFLLTWLGGLRTVKRGGCSIIMVGREDLFFGASFSIRPTTISIPGCVTESTFEAVYVLQAEIKFVPVVQHTTARSYSEYSVCAKVCAELSTGRLNDALASKCSRNIV